MSYEELVIKAEQDGVIVEEYNLQAHDGLCYNDLILIDKKLKTQVEKSCVLAEELGHYHTTVGNILNQKNINNVKQENIARLWSYNHLIGLTGIIECYKKKCTNLHEMAEHLDITEEFLSEALKRYESIFGLCKKVDNYIVYFKPCLGVVELYE